MERTKKIHDFCILKIIFLVFMCFPQFNLCKLNLNFFLFALTQFANPANIYLFKLNNKKTRKRCVIRSVLRIKTPEQRLLLR